MDTTSAEDNHSLAAEEAGTACRRDTCILMAFFIPGLHRLYLKRPVAGIIQLILWGLTVLCLIATAFLPAVEELVLTSIVLGCSVLPTMWLWAWIEAHCLRVDGRSRAIQPGNWWRRQALRLAFCAPFALAGGAYYYYATQGQAFVPESLATLIDSPKATAKAGQEPEQLSAAPPAQPEEPAATEPTPAPAEEPAATEPTPAPAEEPAATEPTPAPAEEPAAVSDNAPATQAGLQFTCSYAGATMAQQTFEDEDYRPFEPIVAEADGNFISEVGPTPITRCFKVFTAGQGESCPKLVKYEKIDKNDAELKIFYLMLRDDGAANAVNKITRDIDRLSAAEILKQLAAANALLDHAETLFITMNSPHEGMATAFVESGDNKIKFRNIAIRIDQGVMPDIAVYEATDEPDPLEEEIDPHGPSFDRSLNMFAAELEDYPCANSTQKLYRDRLLSLYHAMQEREDGDVNVTLPDTKGNTALHYACGLGHYELAQWLISQGADVNKRTDSGATPLDCVKDDSDGRLRALLEEHGAKSGTPAKATAKPAAKSTTKQTSKSKSKPKPKPRPVRNAYPGGPRRGASPSFGPGPRRGGSGGMRPGRRPLW